MKDIEEPWGYQIIEPPTGMVFELNMEHHEKVKQALVDYTKKICVSPESARKALVDEGIYNPDGTLHKNYGGK